MRRGEPGSPPEPGPGGAAHGHRFERDARLLSAADFRRVFANAVRNSRGPVSVLARDNGGLGARLGLAIPKRHARRAVDRNRIKRILRETFRTHRRALHGLDLVVLARPGIAGLTRADLRALAVEHWTRIASRGDGRGTLPEEH